MAHQKPDRPLIIVAGSISWPPARYIVPAIYRDFAIRNNKKNDFIFVYIEEAMQWMNGLSVAGKLIIWLLNSEKNSVCALIASN